MKITIKRLLPIIFALMSVYSGCAKQAVVKKDESLSPSAAKQAPVAADKLGAQPAIKPATTANSAAASAAPGNIPGQNNNALTAAKAANSGPQQALDKIYFDFDSAALSDSARQTLTRNSALLKQNKGLKIRVEGNCDERGSDEYNLALGERRARAAVRYLTTMGISADRLSAISYGKERPADYGHDEAAWAKNRRDEFVAAR